MIEPPEKSKNDIAKEQHECECFRQAVELSSTRGGQTQKILTYLNGAAFEGRSKNDRPDIVNICTKGKKNPIEVMVGIEHFEVNQLSKKSGKKIKSTGREIENKLWKGYDRGHEELLKKGMVSNENCLDLSENMASYIQEKSIRGYPSLVQALSEAVQKHLSSADTYRKNLSSISSGRPIELAFLIEFRSDFQQFFFNDGQLVYKRDDGLIPLTTDIVKILSSIDKNKVDYIILYMTNPLSNKRANVLAVRTGNIRNHLLTQKIKTYKYAGEDLYEGKSSNILPTEIQHIDDKGLYQLNFRYEELSESEIKGKIFLGVRTAFYAQKRGLPFVASRSVQLTLYAIGRYIRAFEPVGEYCQPVLSKKLPYGYVNKKYKEFEKIYGKIEA